MKSLTLKPEWSSGMSRKEKKEVISGAREELADLRKQMADALARVRVPRVSGRDMERELERGGDSERGGKGG